MLVLWLVTFPVAIVAGVFGAAAGSRAGPPMAFVLVWGVGMLVAVATVVLGIVSAVRASKWRWCVYPAQFRFVAEEREGIPR